jgi:hypothetical protein
MTTNLQQFKYTAITHPDDVTRMPLSRNLFGLNNRIYANLGSYGMEKGSEDHVNYSKHFDEQDMRFGCLNRLFQIHIHVREYDADEEYTTHESIDFQGVYELVKKLSKKIEQGKVKIYASYNDSGNKSNKELGVLCIPLGSKVLRDAANYATQEIEKVKMEAFMSNLGDAIYVKQFLDVF